MLTAKTTRALIALVVGLAAGIAVEASGSVLLLRVVTFVEPVGTLWVNGVRMTIVPLIVSLLVVGVSSGTTLRTMGRLGSAALLVFLAILTAAGVLSAVLARPLLSSLTIDPAMAAGLRATAERGSSAVAASVQKLPTLSQWVAELLPSNPIRAAADGNMLPLIIFTLAFAAALTRIDARHTVVAFFRGVSQAMLTIVGWMFIVAPIGVFALALSLGARMGMAAAGAVGYYVGTLCVLLIVLTVLLYPVAVLGGRIGLRRFASAMVPAQVIAFSSRSSSVALPAMITAARERLGLPPSAVDFVLPLALTVFRVSAPISIPVSILFLAKLYGVEISNTQLIALIGTSVVLSFSVPPIPSGSLFVMTPVLVAAGIPAEGVGLLIAADAIPDLFKTTAIVTAHMTATVVVARLPQEAAEPAESTATSPDGSIPLSTPVSRSVASTP
jgi:proton glutamate symport protein